MHERSKLTEARHFLDRMNVEHGNPAAFALELSAFLGAARSVLQYARREAKPKQGGQQWYDQAMANPLFSFFKDLRDNSIHEVPVKPLTKMKTEVAGFLNIGDNDDEMLIPYPHNTIVHQYEFQNRPGEEVTDLSQQYLNALEGLIEDALQWGGSPVDGGLRERLRKGRTRPQDSSALTNKRLHLSEAAVTWAARNVVARPPQVSRRRWASPFSA